MHTLHISLWLLFGKLHIFSLEVRCTEHRRLKSFNFSHIYINSRLTFIRSFSLSLFDIVIRSNIRKQSNNLLLGCGNRECQENPMSEMICFNLTVNLMNSCDLFPNLTLMRSLFKYPSVFTHICRLWFHKCTLGLLRYAKFADEI